MLETAWTYDTIPRVVLVTSGYHYGTKLDRKLINPSNGLRLYGHQDHFTQSATVQITQLNLSIKNGKDFIRRQPVHAHELKTQNSSYLLNCLVFFAQALNDGLRQKPIIVNGVDPGFVMSGRLEVRNQMVRTAEEGSRPMIRAAVGGEKKDEPRGAFISSVSQEEPRDYANSQEGLVAQNKIWSELNGLRNDLIEELIKIEPKVQQNLRECVTLYNSVAPN
ncbi:hypothetical protein CVT25_002524 [Psilocybe cyanescens]|uniref:Uncharacterized protein n=1 Tax=Psilocybe cyanescens TaxID=93625 RepID=A0A409XUD9_PSICY|nr:hypothetical protein CVT25_002524 [Psilocybe cyanescens]